MTSCRRCYVCAASDSDECAAIGGEIAECPRPSPTPRSPAEEAAHLDYMRAQRLQQQRAEIFTGELT